MDTSPGWSRRSDGILGKRRKVDPAPEGRREPFHRFFFQSPSPLSLMMTC